MIDKERSLAYRFPELAKEWHPTKNGDLTPDDVTGGSNRKVWWIGECTHEWDASPKERTHGYGCPICAGKRVVVGINDFASNYPELLTQWDLQKNTLISPTEVTGKSHRKVWWICEKGHSWESSVDNRTRGRGCPYCTSKKISESTNDLASQNPFLASELSGKNTIKSSEVFLNSHSKLWWTCSSCGHEWQATVYSRNQGNGCPSCALRTQSSFPEQAIFYYIKQACPDAINRCVHVLGGGMELDIYIPSFKVGIEYDGQYWHRGKKAFSREKKKFDMCCEKGIYLIRITDSTVLDTTVCNHAITTAYGLDNAIEELRAFIPIPKVINSKGDRFSIAECYIRSKKENSLAIKRPDIAAEWNFQRNGKLTPEMFSEFSMQFKVWWKCKKGHEWVSTIAHRTSMGANCPYCSNRKVLAGYNDLATTAPELLEEWDYNKNTRLPSELTSGSNKKVWWRCELGHSWEAPIAERTRGRSCPVCSGNRIQVGFNDLHTTHAKLADEWNYEKNGQLTPQMVSFGSNKKVWWICSRGHEWQSMVLSRSKGSGCPYCSGRYAICGETDLATTHPSLIEEWDHTKNSPLLPTRLTFGSGEKVFWICKKCGHEWKAAIKNRVKGNGCPACAGKVRKNGSI